MQALLLTNLDPKTTRDSATGECKVYYPLYLKTFKKHLQKKFLRFVSSSLQFHLVLVYSVVKLRLPDDLLVNALTD